MQFFVDTKYDFMSKRRLGFIISSVLVLASIASLLIHGGPRLSIDFTGGTFVQMQFEPAVSTEQLRDALASDLPSSEIQQITGTDTSEYIIRLANEEVETATAKFLGSGTQSDAYSVIQTLIQQSSSEVTTVLQRQETVGPKVGTELRDKAVQSILVALVLMLIYVAFRFSGFYFALGAVAAIFHDVVIVLGIFSVLNMEVSLEILAALLTIAGYSINDTIVVFDRIREQSKILRRQTFEQVINVSINRTLSRTVLTSVTTLFAVLSLYVFGGTVIHDFAFAVLCGVFVGTYSSIFVASALVLVLHEWRAKKDPKPATSGPKKGGGRTKAAATA